MFTLRLHDTLVGGLQSHTTVAFNKSTLTLDDADLLDAWANVGCDNPTGQRACLARAIASLIRVGNGAVLSQAEFAAPPTTFWEASAR